MKIKEATLLLISYILIITFMIISDVLAEEKMIIASKFLTGFIWGSLIVWLITLRRMK